MLSRVHLITRALPRPVTRPPRPSITRPSANLNRSLIAAIATACVVGGLVAAHGRADPSDDALSKLNELSRQAEQTTEAMHTAQLNLNDKLAAQKAADAKHAGDESALEAAKTQLANFQTSVDKFAAAMYMGGRTDGLDAILTADSPQHLIDKVSVQREIATEMVTQMNAYRTASEEAAKAAQESAKSAADARTAAEQAAAVRADVQAKQSRLQLQIAVVKSQYTALTPSQRTALAAPGPVPAGLPVPPAAPPPDGAPDALPPDASVDAMGPTPDGLMPDSPAPDAAVPAIAPGGDERATVVQAALSRVGLPYSWGAAGPSAFDCSGLVMWSFQQAGIALPHSSQALAAGGVPVDLSDLQPGDVLTYYSDASHTGIYVGDGMVVHSSTFGQPIRVVPIAAAGPIHNARRY
jgi:cell wall-associated NlpC family hydrolase